MSEIVRSAIVGEAVSRIFSGIISNHDDNSDEGGNIERLEMAHIKMEAAIEASSKWQITDVSLLHWRKKLKRSAQECDDVLRECKQRTSVDEETKEQVRQYSFPRRVAHATKSFISSFVSRNGDECSSKATVQRFERLADGANDFLAYVQAGGTPRQYLFFDPLIRHLFAGKSLQYKKLHRGSQYHYFAIRPMSFEDRGLEAMLAFIYEDCEQPQNNFRLGFILRLSESTDIIGITIRCLQLVTPHFKSTAEAVIKELTQLPTQDFSWLTPYDYSYGNMNHWNSTHNTLTRWFRPDPLCCKGSERNIPDCRSSAKASSRLSSIFPEPVCEVFLHRYVSPSEYKLKGSSSITDCNSYSHEDFPRLKLGALFMPHDCVDDLKSAVGVETSAIEAIDGEKQQRTLVDIHPHQLDEMLLPKAIDHLYSNAGATTHQISWKSRHGSAYLCVEKVQMLRTRRCRTIKQLTSKRCNKLPQIDQIKKEKEQWKQVARDFLKILAVRSSDRLEGCFTEWINYQER